MDKYPTQGGGGGGGMLAPSCYLNHSYVQHWTSSPWALEKLFYVHIDTCCEKYVNSPSDHLKVVGGEGHEMEETLGVEVEQILAPDFAMVGVEQDRHLKEKMQICQVNFHRGYYSTENCMPVCIAICVVHYNGMSKILSPYFS